MTPINSPPSEFVSEVIPIKYANASEIAAALDIFRTNGVGRTASLEQMDKRLRSRGQTLKSAEIKFVPDERSNSLLVYAGGEDMKLIKEIVPALDTAAAQILIEAVIIEVIGTNGFSADAIANQTAPWTTNFATIAGTDAPSSQANLSAAGHAAGFFRSAAISNDLDSFVTMFIANNRAQVLQRPRIQTSDREPAQLFIGESRPYPSGSYTCGWEYSSIQAVIHGVTLEVTPSIIDGQLLELGLHQTIEEANGTVTIANVGDVPITRRIESSAKTVVSNGNVLVLDGSLLETNAPARPSTFQRILTLNGVLHHPKSVTNQNEVVLLLRPRILPAPEIAAQAAKAQKDKMPAVSHAEHEVQTEEAKRLKQLIEKVKSDPDLGRK